MNDSLLRPSDDLSNLPKPGEIVIYDYNTIRETANDEREFRVKAVQWNIERAYKLDEIIELLTRESTGFKDHGSNKSINHRKPRPPDPSHHDIPYRDFDVMAIQEFDINCARSNYRNSPLELARALQMKCVFLCEFQELYSEKLRNKRSQGGGVHGNGILTWWDVERVEVIEHVEIFDWERDGEGLNEPRRGSRRSLACFLRHPLDETKKLLVYSVHLEVFCGIFGRLRQFSQILAHSWAHLSTHPHQMILGDLNTMAHGLARFFPKYCCDGMRWGSVGWSEAEWWQRNLFAVTPDLAGEDGFNCFLAAYHHPKKPKEQLKNIQVEQEIEHDLEEEEEDFTDCKQMSIFTRDELKNLINPHFFCPFPVSRSKTLEMRGYSGKLDWMLMRGWRVIAKGLDNEGYRRSDHKLLWTEVVAFESNEEVEEVGKAAHDFYYKFIEEHSVNILKFHPPTFPNKKLLIGAGIVGIAGILLYYLTKPN